MAGQLGLNQGHNLSDKVGLATTAQSKSPLHDQPTQRRMSSRFETGFIGALRLTT